MRLIEIPVNTSLDLNFIYKDKEQCMSVICQLKAKEYIFIQAICCNGEPIEKMNTCKPVLCYKTEGGIFNFKNAVYKLIKYQGIYMYAVTCEYDVQRENRRSTYRVFVSEPITLKITKKDGKLITLSGILKDISLSGMGIILNHKVEDYIMMEITLELARNNKINLQGEVVRMNELPNNKGYVYGCKFNTQQEILSRYLLKYQVKAKYKNNK